MIKKGSAAEQGAPFHGWMVEALRWITGSPGQ